jgi:hypothetical protein
VIRPISEITATMEKSFYPFVIADTFRIAAMKFDGGKRSPQQPKHDGLYTKKVTKSNKDFKTGGRHGRGI